MSTKFRFNNLLLSLGKSSLAFALCMTAASAQAPTDIRVALVIGNSSYAGNMALANPANDAAAMSVTLRNLGFMVIETTNANRAQMEDAVKKLFTALKGKQGVGMLYYAGHGMQVDWKNYMVPIDAKMQSVRDVSSQTLDVADVLDALKAAGSRMNIVVLDACRDNPFSEKGSKGLAPVDAPTGTFLAYATAPGNVAEDGTGTNGLYTKHLLTELQKPVSIEGVFKRVRLSVRKESNGRQIPWESTSLEDEFSFLPKAQASVSRGNQRDTDFAEQKAEWDRIRDSGNADDLYSFLGKYPTGLIAEIAQARLDKIARAGISTQGQKGESTSISDRLRVGDEWRVRSTTKSIGIFGGDSSWETQYRVTRRVGENLEVIGQPDGFMMPQKTQIVTPQGAIITTDMGAMGKYEMSPPQALVPLTAFQVGYKSSSRVENIRNGKPQGVEDFDISVLARENITTVLGANEAYKIAVRSKVKGAFESTAREFVQTTWFPQNSLIPLKAIFEMPGTPTTLEETISLKRASP